MKKSFIILSMALFAFTACSNDDNTPAGGNENNGPTQEAYVDASAKKEWNYFSFKEQKFIGKGAENEADNAQWAARTDWDMAISRYEIRTNSGEATSADAKGGVYTCAESVKFDGINSLPSGITFEADKTVTSEGMGNTVNSVVKSTATVIRFKTNADGSLVMPPVFLKAPVYLFRTADGEGVYKVDFTQYKNENGDSGHVKFFYAQIK